MAVTGWKVAGTAANINDGGTTGWTGTGNTTTSNNVGALIGATPKNSYSQLLRLTNLGFTTSDVPSGATIDGVEVEVERSGTSSPFDNVVQLCIASAGNASDRIGSNQASATVWPTSDATATYGGATNKMGATPTDSQVRASSFGLDVKVYGTAGFYDASIDLVRMRVYYSTGGGGTATGLASETDAALALTRKSIRATGIASEAATAVALGRKSIAATGTASEAATAFALGRKSITPTGRAGETDAALALGIAAQTGLATETGTAIALSGVAASAIGLAAEADQAEALSRVQIAAAGAAAETEDALALGAARPVGLAAANDTAVGLAALQIAGVSASEETDFAVSLAALLTVGLAIETDEALAPPIYIAPPRSRTVGRPAVVDRTWRCPQTGYGQRPAVQHSQRNATAGHTRPTNVARGRR